jgi:hypothetical protein
LDLFAGIAPICCSCSDVRNSARNARADDIEHLAGFLLNGLTMSNKKMFDIATPIRATDRNESLIGILSGAAAIYFSLLTSEPAPLAALPLLHKGGVRVWTGSHA